MAFGNKQSREEKNAAKQAQALEQKGLNLDDLTQDQLRQRNAQDISEVNGNLLGSGLYSFGSLLSGNSDTAFLLNAAKAQISQSWILVRQNEQIIRQNEKIIELLSR